jgi:SAM-dependent methyltransferase
MRAWAQYMPGGFATYHVHNPERMQIKNGKKLDYITKMLFRHSYDGRGLRSRSYAMAWWLHQNITEKSNGIRWASIACGTGQPTFDASAVFKYPTHYLLIDSDQEALSFAQKLAKSYDIDSNRLTLRQLNVTSQKRELEDELKLFAPDCIDAMGLLEYLSDRDAASLLNHLYRQLPKGGLLVFTNMLDSHPHLEVHKRALCWPGVNVRSEADVLNLLKSADIPAKATTILLPDDGVYGVYGVEKQ